MIPKIIHYTWFSNDPFPSKVQKCLDSWRKYLPDYEFVKWDMEKIKDIESDFLKEALQEKVWALAADHVRTYAVYHYGGIYLDTDVEVFKSFDDLLNEKCFIGRETSYHVTYLNDYAVTFLTSHCFGAEKNNKFIGACLSYFSGRHFVQSDDRSIPPILYLNRESYPYVQAIIAEDMGWNWNAFNNEKYEHTDFTVFPSEYFDCVKVTTLSYCKHLALGSWRDKKMPTEGKITLSYKIKWRVVAVLEKIMNRLGYVIFRVKK